MTKLGKGTPYALKYVTVTQDEMRHEILPKVVEFCAIKRADELWTAEQYRQCLSRNIKNAIRGQALV
ncbi:hypothetical protein ES708_28120 [subsurface metagenome]|jgi:hypothetical protein